MGHENLCADAVFTGYAHPGGFAQFTTSDEQFSFVIHSHCPDHHAAPLLCAGLIGFRAYRFSNHPPPLSISMVSEQQPTFSVRLLFTSGVKYLLLPARGILKRRHLRVH